MKRVNFNLPTTIAESDQEEPEPEEALAVARAKPYVRPRPHIVFNGTYPIDMPLGQGQSSSSYDPEANLQRYRSYMLRDYVIDEDAEGEEQAIGEEEDEEEEEYEDELFPYGHNDDEDDESYDDTDYYTHSLLNKYGIIPSKEEAGSRERTAAAMEAGRQAGAAAQPQHVWSMEELIANPNIPLNYKKMCSEVEQSLSRFESYLDNKKKREVRTYDIDAPTSSGSGSRSGSGRSPATLVDPGLALRSKKKL